MILDRLFANQAAVTPAPDGSWLQRVHAGGAVCALTDDHDRLVQLLATQSLRRALRTRLAPPENPTRSRRADLSAVVARVWWQATGSVFETDWTYLNVARQLQPQDYRKGLAFGPAWFARIDSAERFPRWTPSSEGFGPQVTSAGPFVTRRQAARFIHHLEEVFDLCRYHHILVQYPNGQPCAYLDMGKCPAPCNGSIDLEEYRRMLLASAEFATGDGGALGQTLSECMRTAAANLQFELAQRLKEALQHVQEAENIKGRLASSPQALNYLIVQPGVQQRCVRPFFVRAGCIDPGEETPVDQLDAATESWAETMSSDKPEVCAPEYRAECVWLLSRHLGKQGKLRGAWIEQPDFTNAQRVSNMVRECFDAKRAAD